MMTPNVGPHFAVGKWIVRNNKRYQIMAYTESNVVLLPLDETGPIIVACPPFLKNLL